MNTVKYRNFRPGKTAAAAGKWFVMMYSLNGDRVMPIVSSDDDPRLWDTWWQAEDFAKNHLNAKVYGFQVYEVGERI